MRERHHLCNVICGSVVQFLGFPTLPLTAAFFTPPKLLHGAVRKLLGRDAGSAWSQVRLQRRREACNKLKIQYEDGFAQYSVFSVIACLFPSTHSLVTCGWLSPQLPQQRSIMAQKQKPAVCIGTTLTYRVEDLTASTLQRLGCSGRRKFHRTSPC